MLVGVMATIKHPALSFSKLSGITTDGAPSMVGRQQNLGTYINLKQVKSGMTLSHSSIAYYSIPSLYRASPIAVSLLCGIFYSAFFTVNPDWLRGFTVV